MDWQQLSELGVQCELCF